jgi:hypothetical protein
VGREPRCGANFVVRYERSTDSGLVMTIASLQIEPIATAREEVLAAKGVRILIAHRLGVDVKRVTDEGTLH